MLHLIGGALAVLAQRHEDAGMALLDIFEYMIDLRLAVQQRGDPVGDDRGLGNRRARDHIDIDRGEIAVRHREEFDRQRPEQRRRQHQRQYAGAHHPDAVVAQPRQQRGA